MASFENDQAEGLRRMLGQRSSRIVTFVSAAPVREKQTLLLNLAACLHHVGRDVVLFDARKDSAGVATDLAPPAAASLLEAARGERRLEDVRYLTGHGFAIAALTRGPMPRVSDQQPLAGAFECLARGCDVLLADAELDDNGDLPLAAMAGNEIIVQLTNNAESIVKAYGLIKRLHARLGRRPFSILVSGATEKEARAVHANLAQAANRYLALQLRSIGSVPADRDLQRAAQLARPVIDAFPMAAAAQALRRLATHFLPPGSLAEASAHTHAGAELVIAGA